MYPLIKLELNKYKQKMNYIYKTQPQKKNIFRDYYVVQKILNLKKVHSDELNNIFCC